MLGAIWDISELTNRMCFLKAAILKLGFEKNTTFEPKTCAIVLWGQGMEKHVLI